MNVNKIFSIIFGGCFFFITLVVLLIIDPDLALPLAVLSFLIASVLLYTFLIISNKKSNIKYLSIEKELKVEFLFKVNGNYKFESKIINGNIYFGENSMVFISLDKKPYSFYEISKNEIDKIELESIVCINVYTKSEKCISVSLPNAKEVLDKIKAINLI